jgi:dihydroflavonol-4-reductase
MNLSFGTHHSSLPSVCITGGTGFLGSYLVRLLSEKGHRLRVLHRPNSKLTALEGLRYESALGDVTDEASMRKAFEGCDWVFHAAAVADYWRADKDYMFEVNVEGTRKVLAAAKAANVQRIIFTSSAAAIGLPKDKNRPSDESVPFNLPPEKFPYGYSKVQAEALVQEAVAQGQNIVTLNPTGIIGAGDLNLISGTFIEQVAKLQWLVPSSKGGMAISDVRDVAVSHLAAAEKGRIGERYILNTANYSYSELFGLIAEVIGVAPPLIEAPSFILPFAANAIDLLRSLKIPTPIDANQARLGGKYVYFDASKAHRELHQPQIDMRQSIKETYDWYLEHGYIQENLMTKTLKTLGRLWNA